MTVKYVLKYFQMYLGDSIAPGGEASSQLRTGLYEARSTVPGPWKTPVRMSCFDDVPYTRPPNSGRPQATTILSLLMAQAHYSKHMIDD